MPWDTRVKPVKQAEPPVLIPAICSLPGYIVSKLGGQAQAKSIIEDFLESNIEEYLDEYIQDLEEGE